jgi:hypothetical protein
MVTLRLQSCDQEWCLSSALQRPTVTKHMSDFVVVYSRQNTYLDGCHDCLHIFRVEFQHTIQYADLVIP